MFLTKEKEILRPMPSERETKKFFHSRLKGRFGSFLMVKPPGDVRIYLEDYPENKGFKVHVPRHLFGALLVFKKGIRLVKCGLWFLKDGSPSMRSRVYLPCLPNMVRSGIVCYGNAQPRHDNALRIYMEKLYKTFWMTVFNYDLSDSRNNCPVEWKKEKGFGWEHLDLPPYGFILEKWEKASAEGKTIGWKEGAAISTIIRTLWSYRPYVP